MTNFSHISFFRYFEKVDSQQDLIRVKLRAWRIIEQQRKKRLEGWCSNSIHLLLLVNIQRRKLVESWCFSLLWSSETNNQMRHSPGKKNYISNNHQTQSSLHSVYISVSCSLSSTSIFPASFIILMSKGLIIWGHYNTRQLKIKYRGQGQDVLDIYNSVISFKETQESNSRNFWLLRF